MLLWVAAVQAEAPHARASPAEDWLSYGRTYSEQRFSPLDQINTATVGNLGLAWSLDLDGIKSLEATPLEVDGTLYFSGNDSIVFAVDARSGRLLWRHDPEVWKHAGKRYRLLFPVNRGVAFWKGKVYVGTHDGRLIALDARTGAEAWSVQTLERETGYITGAPRAFNDKIVIGNGGAEAGVSRGYASAYDAATGRMVWRYYTVPGDPAKGFENASMAMAAKTWTGEWWKFGGGGTVWNAITYDPEFNRVYLGVGNGSPWNQHIRSPGGGDNLFLSSIVALDADTGRYAWHYQTTPGESWDYTSAQDIVLADLHWKGADHQVILHAPKNGFFYVIDRSDGRLLGADKLGRVTWADHVDLKTGRPVENPDVRPRNGGALIYPSSVGLHDWQAMSFNPGTGLAYLPTVDMPQYFSDKNTDVAAWRTQPFRYNTGYDVLDVGDFDKIDLSASLVAWDPLKQVKAWEVRLPGLWNGGTMTTAGGLVFEGDASGEFAAYDARTGAKRWSMDAGLGIVAAPISYALDGRQYVAVLVGWGGALPGAFGAGVARHGWRYGAQPRRVLVFALGASGQLAVVPPSAPERPLDDVALTVDAASAAAGNALFNSTCHLCHGFMAVSGGVAPDLRASSLALDPAAFRKVVKAGLLEQRGMPRFDDLTDLQVQSLYWYVRQRARADAIQANSGARAPAAAEPAGTLGLQGAPNFRDIGGYTAADGRHVRRGDVYRSSELSKLTPADAEKVDALGLVSVVDLRTADERTQSQSVWVHVPADLYVSPKATLAPVMRTILSAAGTAQGARAGLTAFYTQMPDEYRAEYAAMFQRIAGGRLPLLVHCTAGKDRTGVAMALLLTTLGVPRRSVLEDYELTEKLVPPAVAMAQRPTPVGGAAPAQTALAQLPEDARRALWRSDPDYVAAALDAVDRDYGSIDAYLERGLGLSKAQIDAVRRALLE